MKTRRRKPVAERFWSKVDKTGECWLWTASLTSHGYGQLMNSDTRRPMRAHRVAYELVKGPIPDGMQLDHLCRVRRCVNPDHLEPVTNQENARRSPIIGGWQRRLTHCHRGHPFDEANTYVYYRNGIRFRHCRACQRFVAKRQREERRAA